MRLGDKLFSTNIVQGPLAGVSCAPFRRLTWQHSKPAFICTEMISCKTLLHQSEASLQRFIHIDPEEGPVCFQLSASEPDELAEATRRVTAQGADLIDLNCGCPVKKIRSKGAGSRLLSSPSKLYRLISAMKQNTHLPVSVKIRVDGTSDEAFNQEIARIVTEAGADFLVVHGRHWTEKYDTSCHYEDIQFFVEQMKIPVIGNGDIACVDSLKKMFATGCAGVMISRAGVGQPWLIDQLTAEMRHENYNLPSAREIGDMFIEHTSQLVTLLGNEKFAILQARKFAKYYARMLANKAELCEKINTCEDMKTLRKICGFYFN